MATFAYAAINASGLDSSGQISAPDANAAREQLRVRGLLANMLEELPASHQDVTSSSGSPRPATTRNDRDAAAANEPFTRPRTSR